MHLIGRWERVRGYRVGPGRWDPPLMLDRKWSTLSPFACEEWHQTRDGVWIPAIRGGALSFPNSGPDFALSLFTRAGTALSATTVALDSAYTFNSAGDGVAHRMFGRGKAIANAYYYISAVAAGTQVNINDINAELRNDNGSATAPNRASPTLHASGSADPNGETTWIGWHKIALSAFTTTEGTIYWLIVADADGGGTDYATVQHALGNSDVLTHLRALAQPYDATNGFVSNPTARAGWPLVLLEHSDGTVAGWAVTSHATVTSNTERKGLRHDGFTETIKLLGALAGNVASITGAEVYDDDGTVPGGTTQASGTTVVYNSAGTAIGALLSAAYSVPKATAQRVVFTHSASGARKLSIGTTNGYETVLRAARPGGAGWYYAWANGTTNWANDDQDAQPDMTLLFEDQVAVAGGLRTRPLANRGGVT